MNYFFQYSNKLTITNSKISSFKKSLPNIEMLVGKIKEDFKLFIITDKENILLLKEIDAYIISDSFDADVVVIDDNNIDDVISTYKENKNILLKVSDEDLFFENINKLKNLTNYIELSLDRIDKYDLTKLNESLNKITEILKEKKDKLIIENLNGFYLINHKFNSFGEKSLFIGMDDCIYYHPDFYYNKTKFGKIATIEEYESSELDTYFTNPNFICIACETFYCNRDIYNNRILTNEYKTPCSFSCMRTTLFNKYSIRLLNYATNSNYDENINLDIIKTIKREQLENLWMKFLENKIESNKIKKMDFSDRMFNG